MPIYMIMPRYLIIMHFSINCSTVICSPPVILMLSWDKPLVKSMAPRSLFHYIESLFHIIESRLHLASFWFTILQSLLSNLYTQKYQTYLLYRLSISIRSHFCKWSWRDWQPLYRVGCKVLICLCRYEGFACSLLLDWYIGSQKLREILTLLCDRSPTYL